MTTELPKHWPFASAEDFDDYIRWAGKLRQRVLKKSLSTTTKEFLLELLMTANWEREQLRSLLSENENTFSMAIKAIDSEKSKSKVLEQMIEYHQKILKNIEHIDVLKKQIIDRNLANKARPAAKRAKQVKALGKKDILHRAINDLYASPDALRKFPSKKLKCDYLWGNNFGQGYKKSTFERYATKYMKQKERE